MQKKGRHKKQLEDGHLIQRRGATKKNPKLGRGAKKYAIDPKTQYTLNNHNKSEGKSMGFGGNSSDKDFGNASGFGKGKGFGKGNDTAQGKGYGKSNGIGKGKGSGKGNDTDQGKGYGKSNGKGYDKNQSNYGIGMRTHFH